jgi:hypothetical protein
VGVVAVAAGMGVVVGMGAVAGMAVGVVAGTGAGSAGSMVLLPMVALVMAGVAMRVLTASRTAYMDMDLVATP